MTQHIKNIEGILVSVGKILREARNRKGLTLKKLSEKTGININSLAKYERAGEDGGAYPPYDKLVKLCLALEINPLDLLTEAAGTDVDTSSFYRDANPEGQIDRATDLVQEASRIVDRVQPKAIGGEFVATGDMPLLALENTVSHIGIHSRKAMSLTKKVLDQLKELELEELWALADSQHSFPFELPELDTLNELNKSEREKLCDEIENGLIASVLYGDTLPLQDFKGLSKIVDAVNRASHSGGLIESEAVETQGMLDADEETEVRWRRELPKQLVRLVVDGKAIELSKIDDKDEEEGGGLGFFD